MNQNVETNSLEEALRYGKNYLKQLNMDEYEQDAWQLLSFTLGISRGEYYLNNQDIMEENAYKTYVSYIEQRGKRVPLQYITREQEFMGLTFSVTEDVLIPRFDTEILVDEALKECEGKDVLDVCTGSGCIIIALNKLGNLKSAMGLDISIKALEVARYNNETLDGKVTFVESDIFENIKGKYDVIVSNPPYIPTKDIEVLMDEVKIHEPFLALDGKGNGLYFYKKIVDALPSYLKQDGVIFFEIGYDQGEAVSKLLCDAKFTDITVIKDLANHDRVVKARYTNYLEHFT